MHLLFLLNSFFHFRVLIKFLCNIVDGREEVDDCPVEEVRHTVPITDDPTLLASTFRVWVLGVVSCACLSFLNALQLHKDNPTRVSPFVAQVVTYLLGKFMAAKLPNREFKIPFTNFRRSLNPGPFNVKEHVVITVLANMGANGVYATNVTTIIMAFYSKKINILAALLLFLSTQMIGYGWAGIFRKFLVDSPYMWWPSILAQVSVFRAFHEKEERPEGGITRLRLFAVVFLCSFTYYIIPGYLFKAISIISTICIIWKKDVIAHQIGSGSKGLGIFSFTLDWNVVTGLGSPLVVPGTTIINILVGSLLFNYIILPIAYWNNLFLAMNFPLFGVGMYDKNGDNYDVHRILNARTFSIDIPSYKTYSKLYMSLSSAFTYELSFAILPAIIVHVLLFHGKMILQVWRKTKIAPNGQVEDVHGRTMKKNYKQVPIWWFFLIVFIMSILAIICCEGFSKQLQLPWWGFFLSQVIVLFFTLGIGALQATTDMQVGLNLLTELISGYLYPGKPVANVVFKTYGYIGMTQALDLLGHFKLGHYMKIPPRLILTAMMVGTVVNTCITFGVHWWHVTTIEGICNEAKLPAGSPPLTCSDDEVFYQASVLWGVLGADKIFGKDGVYPSWMWPSVMGVLLTLLVWLIARQFPNQKWIRHVNVPLILAGGTALPQVQSVSILAWGFVGMFFKFYIYPRYKSWWSSRTFIFSAAMDDGVASMNMVIHILQSQGWVVPAWWGRDADAQCKLAKCPRAPGITVKGCPVHRT